MLLYLKKLIRDMQILRKWQFYIILFVILVAFFVPKNSGYAGSGMNLFSNWHEKECSCLGFKFESNVIDGPTFYFCSGIPFSCKCFEKMRIEKDTEQAGSIIQQKEIICEDS